MTRRSPSFNVDWREVLAQARKIVADQVERDGEPPGVRDLFYSLFSIEALPNSIGAYQGLSRTTAALRRRDPDALRKWGEEGFPDLADATREIDKPIRIESARDGLLDLRHHYRGDRTASQPYLIYLATEKRGFVRRVRRWFPDLDILPLAGFASQTLADDVRREVEEDGRPAVMIVFADFDPSGIWLPRIFAERCGAFDEVVRVGLNKEQVLDTALGLPENPDPAKQKDSRYKAFIEEFGLDAQVEVNALEVFAPGTLRRWLQAAIGRFWDEDAYQEDLAAEQEQIRLIDRAIRLLDEDEKA